MGYLRKGSFYEEVAFQIKIQQIKNDTVEH